MLLDWEAGRPMELEVILGNPVKIARAKGFDMPRLQSMYALLKVSPLYLSHLDGRADWQNVYRHPLVL